MSVFHPILSGATLPDRLIACVGATIAIAFTILVCGALPLAPIDVPVIVAPLGASAVLVFAVPSSPLARPWSVIGGNMLSTLIGVAAFRYVPGIALASGVAVGAAILVMSVARCLHPPGGAAALTAVIGSQGIHDAGYWFALTPVGINSIALVFVGLLFRHIVTLRSATPPGPSGSGEAAMSTPLHEADIDAALADMHTSFDISRSDLDQLLQHAERHAANRRAGKPS